MSIVRRFLLAPSLARLLRRERGGARIIEGYFPPREGRTSLVRVEGGQCSLVLITNAPEAGPVEERTEVPRAHADALLDVCAGRAIFDRSRTAVGSGLEAQVDHFSKPGRLDLASVTFESADAARAFTPPPWFGPEVTDTPAYEVRVLAMQGVPDAPEVAPSNAGLNALLDQFEGRFGLSRSGSAPRPPAQDPRVMEVMRRLATTPLGSGAARTPLAAVQSPAPAANGADHPQVPEPPLAAEPIPDPHPAEAGPVEAATEPVHAANAPEPAAAEEHAEVLAPIDLDGPAGDAVGEDGTEEPADVDDRMSDVIENLSQALGAAASASEADHGSDRGGTFVLERWTARARRGRE